MKEKKNKRSISAIVFVCMVIGISGGSCENFMDFEEVKGEESKDVRSAGLESLFGEGKKKKKDLENPKLRVSQGEYGNKIVVAWQAVENANFYRVFRRKKREKAIPFREIKETVLKTTYDDIFSVGTMEREELYGTYEYKVEAFTVEGKRSASVTSEGGYLLLPPREVNATRNASDITVRWDASRGALRYKVYRSKTEDSIGSELPFTLEGNLRYFKDIDESVEFGILYYYSVVSMRGEERSMMNVSSMSVGMRVDAKAPKPPKVEASKGTSISEIEVRWNAAKPYDEGNTIVYTLHRSSSESSRMITVLKSSESTMYRDTNVKEQVEYYYFVQAIEMMESGEQLIGGYSANVEAELGDGNSQLGYILSSPVGVTAKRVANDIELRWTKAKKAEGYKVYVSEMVDGTYNELEEVGNIDTHVHIGAFTGDDDESLKFYKVVSVSGEMVTDIERASVSMMIPAIPRGVTVTENFYDSAVSEYSDFDGRIYPIKVSWRKSWGAESYVLWRSQSKEGDYLQIENDIVDTEVYDIETDYMEAGKRYYYKVSARGDEKENYSERSEAAEGYGALSNKELAQQWYNTIKSSHGKLKLMHINGLDALGSETKKGSVSGKVAYNASLNYKIRAIAKNRYTNYADNDFLVINGTNINNVNKSSNGVQDADYRITGMYEAQIIADLELTSATASGGTYIVIQSNGIPQGTLNYDEVE